MDRLDWAELHRLEMEWLNLEEIQHLERNVPPTNQIFYQASKSAPVYIGAQKFAQKMLAGVKDINVPNLPEELEIAMNNIRLEADKECSLKYVESFTKAKKMKLRRSTLLRKACMIVNSGWRKGRLYCVHKHNLLMTPTNMTSISWLDLAEYSLNFRKTFRSCRDFSGIFNAISKRPHYKYEYNLETPHRDYTRQFENFTTHYFEQVEHCLKLEKTLNMVVTLPQMWDSVRFVRYMNSIEDTMSNDRELHLRIIPRLLVEHCNDSKIVVNYFMIMTYLFPSRLFVGSILELMKLPYLHFFMIHTMNVLLIHPQRSHFKLRIIQDLNLVERAFPKGLDETLELLLGFGWPHRCFSHNDFYLFLHCGPAFSYAETVSFLLFLFESSRVGEMKKLTHSIRLFWRCLKNPYTTSDDLAFFLQCKHMEDAIACEWRMHTGEEFPLPDNTDPYIVEFLSSYPTDCLATYQPRSLLHLSRCKIRETINMMESVNVLPLSDHLKDYLWLKW